MISYDRILAELEREASLRPEWRPTLDLHRALVVAQAGAPVPPARPALTSQEAAARLAQGRPLHSPEALDLDVEALARLCSQIACIAAQHRPELAPALATMQTWLRERKPECHALAQEYLREGRVQPGEDDDLDGDLLTFLLNNALHPHLRAQAEALAPLLGESQWHRGRCPVCGGEPDFAALGKESGTRRLLCARCDTEWLFSRVGCPFCGDDTRSGYYPSEDRVYRLYVCDACRRYLKTLDGREAARERPLPVERILTVGMDLAAREAGYR